MLTCRRRLAFNPFRKSPQMLLIVSVVACVVAAAAAAAPSLVTEGGAKISTFGYPHGIMRLTIVPDGRFVYQPSDIIVPSPVEIVPEATETSARTWIAQHGHCELKFFEEESRITSLYSCRGTELISAASSSIASDPPHVTFSFPAAKTMYGLAEHAADLPLRPGSTYELYNRDADQYALNSTKSLYGSIPFIMAYSATASSGVLFLNAAETDVHILDNTAVPSCTWKPEVGAVDIFFLPGPTPAQVQQQHASLTGPTMLPPYFSLGYHQCRWSYMNTKDCLSVDEGFDHHNMPYDVLWLDIEHTHEKNYFTWDNRTFPEPRVLTDALASKGRKLVTIKEPSVKRDSGYAMHNEAAARNYYVKNANGTDFEGHSWPGLSSWPDFLNYRTREWYAKFFHDDNYPGGSRDIHTWVSMNEPSIFDGPNGTLAKTAVHTLDSGEKVEHRYLHNAYGLYSVISAYKGALEAAGSAEHPERPFLLTRSFFSGSQRYAAMWTGANVARWDHLQNSIPELLSISVSNYPFCGADVGGFLLEPEEELFVRWMQASVFMPFYRANAHLDSSRREPWTFSLDAQNHIRNALALRYALVPYLYTAFYFAHIEGSTIMRPLIYEFPAEEELREVQNTFMFGPSVLVQPVVSRNATRATVKLPKSAIWYNYFTGEASRGGDYQMMADISTIPMFLRGGHIVPMKLRLRRSTWAARLDPFTLYVALTSHGNSDGKLYLDDGATFDYQQGSYIRCLFNFSKNTLTSLSSSGTPQHGGAFLATNMVERVVILGYQGKPTGVFLTSTEDGTEVTNSLDFERVRNSIIIRKPSVAVTANWTIRIETE